MMTSSMNLILMQIRKVQIGARLALRLPKLIKYRITSHHLQGRRRAKKSLKLNSLHSMLASLAFMMQIINKNFNPKIFKFWAKSSELKKSIGL
jgi:hypothetical protein